MARISVERTHSLGLEAAREKAQPLVEKLASQYGLTPTWVGDTVKLKRSGVNGTLQISETTLSPGGTPKSNTIGTNQGTTATPPQISVGRVGWREIKDFIQH